MNSNFQTIDEILAPNNKKAAKAARKLERALALTQRLEAGGREVKNRKDETKFRADRPSAMIKLVCRAIRLGMTPDGIRANAPSLAARFPWGDVAEQIAEAVADEKNVAAPAVLRALGLSVAAPQTKKKTAAKKTAAKKTAAKKTAA